MLEFAQHYSKELTALAAVLIAWCLNRFGRARARLHYTVQHASTLLVDEPLKDKDGNQIAPKQPIHTASVAVTNSGSETAKNVEIVFHWKPMFHNVWPVRSYEQRQSAHDTYALVFPSLAPNEAINIDLVAINAALPGVATVRSDEVTGTIRAMTLQPVHPHWKLLSFAWFFVAGIAATGYLAAYAIQLISAG